MRILHFGSNYLPGKGGNAVRMTNMLENNRENVRQFVLTTAEKGGFDDDGYFCQMGIKIFRIGTLEEARAVLPEIVGANRIDAVVTHTIPANMVACRCLPKSVTIVTEVHSLIDSGRIKNYGKALLHRLWLNRRTSLYFVLSKGAATYLQQRYGISENKIIFLPNGYTSRGCVRRAGNPEFFTFGYAGTFYGYQGTGAILDNAERILGIADDVRLYLIGGGEREDEFRTLARKHPGRVELTGLVPACEVEGHMGEVDVMLIPRPSTLETETAIPLKIFDGVERGKPLIISNVGGLAEVLGEDEAYVFDKRDPDGLFRACERVYADKDNLSQRYERACQKLLSWPSWDDVHAMQATAIRGVVG